jgi:protein tyrosine phosphatase
LRGYIATQGPLARTSHDFWRMIVQYRVEQIVMLTGLIEGDKNKCHEYFPKHKGTVTFSNMKITCIDEANGDHYIRRTLEVENVRNRCDDINLNFDIFIQISE